MSQHLSINGYRAEVLSDGWYAGLFFDGQIGKAIDLTAPKGRITKKWLDAAKDRAEAEGASEILVRRTRYVSYSLSCIMKQTSGNYSTVTRYRRNDEGRWYSVRSSESDLY